MYRLTLAQANAMIEAALVRAAELALKPMTVTVHDPGGNLIACQRQDGTGNFPVKIAAGKVSGALGIGQSSRRLGEFVEARPSMLVGLNQMAEGPVVAAAGALIVCDQQGVVVGAIGVTGDTPDNDEACALAGIEAVGLKPKG